MRREGEDKINFQTRSGEAGCRGKMAGPDKLLQWIMLLPSPSTHSLDLAHAGSAACAVNWSCLRHYSKWMMSNERRTVSWAINETNLITQRKRKAKRWIKRELKRERVMTSAILLVHHQRGSNLRVTEPARLFTDLWVLQVALVNPNEGGKSGCLCSKNEIEVDGIKGQ